MSMIAFGLQPDGNVRLTNGRLSTAPVNLGHLAFSGYVADTRSFYCPSGLSMPKYNWAIAYSQGGQHLNNLNELQMLGPFNAKSLASGDYAAWYRSKGWSDVAYGTCWYMNYGSYPNTSTWAQKYGAVSGRKAKSIGVMGHYQYRNASLVDYRWSGGTTPYGMPLYWCRPRMRAYPGCATFKTDRQLAGRALVADDFAHTIKEYTETKPGQGTWMHKDGYNVLYGNGSVAWFGDSQLTLAWMDTGGGSSTWWTGGNTESPSFGSVCGWRSDSGYKYIGWPGVTKTGVEVWQRDWHLMDLSAGIDNVGDGEIARPYPASNTWTEWPPP
jgi:hypothetical protein